VDGPLHLHDMQPCHLPTRIKWVVVGHVVAFACAEHNVRISVEARREGRTHEKSWLKFVNNTFEFIFSSLAVSSFVSHWNYPSLDKLNFFGVSFRTNGVGVVESYVVPLKIGNLCTVA